MMRPVLAEHEGFSIIPAVVGTDWLTLLRVEAGRLAMEFSASAHGIRRVLERSRTIREFVENGPLRPLIPAGYSVVRSILFDKMPGANWKVAWHQDLTLAVQERRDLPGFGPWSTKEDVPHVQPPAALLERMLTLRLHLDDADGDNGALRVIPGSHRHGRLSAARIQELRAESPEILCAALAGDVLMMRPLLLHASAPATQPSHRRVIHLELAPTGALPPTLGWAELTELPEATVHAHA